MPGIKERFLKYKYYYLAVLVVITASLIIAFGDQLGNLFKGFIGEQKDTYQPFSISIDIPDETERGNPFTATLRLIENQAQYNTQQIIAQDGSEEGQNQTSNVQLGTDQTVTGILYILDKVPADAYGISYEYRKQTEGIPPLDPDLKNEEISRIEMQTLNITDDEWSKNEETQPHEYTREINVSGIEGNPLSPGNYRIMIGYEYGSLSIEDTIQYEIFEVKAPPTEYEFSIDSVEITDRNGGQCNVGEQCEAKIEVKTEKDCPSSDDIVQLAVNLSGEEEIKYEKVDGISERCNMEPLGTFRTKTVVKELPEMTTEGEKKLFVRLLYYLNDKKSTAEMINNFDEFEFIVTSKEGDKPYFKTNLNIQTLDLPSMIEVIDVQ